MGWDEKFWKIVPSHGTKKFFDPIPWDGIPFKNLSSHPMGQLKKFYPMGRFLLSHGIPRGALVLLDIIGLRFGNF
jgi:hypothetical protein